MIHSELEKFGLSPRESKVYISLLELGSSTVGPISEKTKLPTPKIYPTLQKLQEKGLSSYITKSKTKYFQAASPKNILRNMKEKESKFQELLPRLNALPFGVSNNPSAEVFQGHASTKTLFEDLLEELTPNDYYYAFAFKVQYLNKETAKNFLKHFHQSLADKNIPDKLIAHKSVKKEVSKNFEGNNNIEISFTEIEIPLGLIITPKQIIIGIWGDEEINIRINSPSIAKQYALFFENLWNINDLIKTNLNK